MVATQYANRRRALLALVRKQGAAAALLTHAADLRYLTGFGAEDSWLLLSARLQAFLTDSRYTAEARQALKGLRVVRHATGLPEKAAELLRRMRAKTVLVDGASLTFGAAERLRKRWKGRLKQAAAVLKQARAVKTPAEVAAVERALRAAEAAVREALTGGKALARECELSARYEYALLRRGATAAFAPIVAAGKNAAYPHYRTGQARLRRSEGLLFDFGARLDGYCSDCTRCFFWGKPSRRLGEIYRVVLDANLAGIAAVRPGARACDVDRAARALIARAGYGRYFGHSLGHGVGLDVHERPTLGPRSEDVLAPGQIVTVEPGIYLPGKLGVRIEDLVLVTETGRRVLTRLPTAIEDVIL